MFRTVPLSNIRSYFAVHTAMLYVTQVCWQLASSILLRRAGNFLTVATGRNWKFCLLSLSLSLTHTHIHRVTAVDKSLEKILRKSLSFHEKALILRSYSTTPKNGIASDETSSAQYAGREYHTSQDTTTSDKTLMMSLKNISWTVTANTTRRFNNQINADTSQSPQQHTLRYL